MPKEVIDYTVLSCFLTYAINGDDSGLEPHEIEAWDNEFKAYSGNDYHFSTPEDEVDSFFARCDITGMRGDCSTLQVVVMGEKAAS